jgi:tetratricopeptide (TPR) repeat protein
MIGTTMKRLPILIFAFLTVAVWASHEKAVRLNDLGYEAYEAKDYPNALDYFAAAIEEDENYLYPHHNYACVLALTYREGDTRSLRTIIRHLKRTLELDRNRIQKILQDSDLDKVRREPEFIDFILDGRGISGSFADPCSGDLYPCYCFSFNTRGDVTMAVGIDMVPCTVVRQGRYAIMGSDLILYIEGYSQPVQCESHTITPGNAGEHRDDFLWGKVTEGGVDLTREGYGLIDSKRTSNYQCRPPEEPEPWQNVEDLSVTTGPGRTSFSLKHIRFTAREQPVESMGLLDLRALASLSVPQGCADCPEKLVLISNYYVGGGDQPFLNEAFLIDFDEDSAGIPRSREVEARFSLPRTGIRLWVYPVHAGAGEDVLAIARKEFLFRRKMTPPFLEFPQQGDETKSGLAFLDWTMTLKPLGGEPRPYARLSPPGEKTVTVTGDNILQFFGIEKLDYYSTAGLASLLEVSEGVLRKADFIAVDLNGIESGGGGFKSSRWTFSDGTRKETIDHQFNAKPEGAVLTNVTREDAGNLYNRLFGTSLAPGTDLGILLLDLASIGIDAASPLFTVTLAGGGKDCRTECPELMFMGILNVASATVYFSR